jgi:hypothetical protein
MRRAPVKGNVRKKRKKGGMIHEDRYDRNACIRSINHSIFSLHGARYFVVVIVQAPPSLPINYHFVFNLSNAYLESR